MKKAKVIISLALFGNLCAVADEAPTNMGAMQQSPTTSSEPARFGAGFVVGQPIGPNVKFWLNDSLAIDGTFGWSLRDDDNVYLNADVLWHDFNLIPVSTGQAAVYVGVGPSIEFRHEEDNRFGIRAPVGISYKFENKPLDVFAEIAPILDLSPHSQGDFSVGIGVRYWF